MGLGEPNQADLDGPPFASTHQVDWLEPGLDALDIIHPTGPARLDGADIREAEDEG